MMAAREAEKVHAGMDEKARQAVRTGQDATGGDLYICEMCGWTVEGEYPDRCPIWAHRAKGSVDSNPHLSPASRRPDPREVVLFAIAR